MRVRSTSPKLTWWEFGLRLALVLGILALVDVTARAEQPVAPLAFDTAFRLPADGSLEELAPFIRHIRSVRAQHPDDVIVVFLGASPAYGVGIKDSKNTFSASFESAAATDSRTAGTKVRAYNLASNGLLLGDQYVIAKAVGDAADLFVVQLTYQTFDPRRSASRMRESDLASMLGVGITSEEARALGVEQRTDTSLDRAIEDAVHDRWYTLEHKDEISKALSLEDSGRRLYRFVAGTAPIPDKGGDPSVDASGAGPIETSSEESPAPETAATEESPAAQNADVDPTTPFDELDPALQMVAIARASENSQFLIKGGNQEVEMLGLLARLFRARRQRAAFFMAPMDEEVIAAYEVLDEAQYKRNVSSLRTMVSNQGYELLDYHADPFLTSADFVDLTHTTDSGGALTGARLWKDLRTSVESVPKQ